MRRPRLIWVVFAIGLALLFYVTIAKSQIQPSYPLPESGTITDLGPNGMTVYQYRDHGRTYDAYGPQGYQHQQYDRGNITRFGPLTPRDDDRDVEDILRQWREHR